MSNQIPSQYILQYEDEMRLAYQFEGPKLRGLVRNGTNMGAGASPADYVGPMLANDNPGRLAATPNNNATVTRRWVYPNYFDIGTQIAKQDVSRTFNGGSLQTGYAKAQGKAMGRKVDDILMESLFITATTGQNAGSTTAFLSSNIIADSFNAAAATGCTVAKLIEGKRILEAGGVDLENEKLTCIITSTDHAFLLKQIEIRSKDYNDKPQLVDGYLRNYLGIDFVHLDFQNAAYYPRAAAQMVNGSSERLVPLFANSALYLGEWTPIGLRANERPDLSYAWQLYSYAEIGATRLQETGVVQLICQ
jgi:hypothetical protein